MEPKRQLKKPPMFTYIDRAEDELYTREDTLHPVDESPVRFEIMKETLKRGEGGPTLNVLPIMNPRLFGIRKTLRSLKDNPVTPKRLA